MQNREPPFLQNEWGIFYSFLSSFSFLVLSKAENGTFCFLKWTKKKNAGKKALFLQRFSIYCEKQQIGKRNTKIFFFSAVSTYLPHTRTYAGFFHSSHRGLYIDKHTHNEHLQGFQTGSSKIGWIPFCRLLMMRKLERKKAALIQFVLNFTQTLPNNPNSLKPIFIEDAKRRAFFSRKKLGLIFFLENFLEKNFFFPNSIFEKRI